MVMADTAEATAQESPGEAEASDGQAALDARVDALLAAYGDDARAVIEVLLLVSDTRARAISRGYVRGLVPGARLVGHAG